MINSRILNTALVPLVFLTVFSSCQKEPLSSGAVAGCIRVSVSSSFPELKSSGSESEELVRTIVMDEDSLLLQEFVSDNLSMPFAGTPDTKGAIATSSNISAVYDSLGMEIFIDNYLDIDGEGSDRPVLTNSDQYVEGGTVSYSSGGWNLSDRNGNQCRWLWKMYHSFWTYAPKTHSGTYSYGSVGSRNAMSITGFINPTSASDQHDLLIAYNNRLYDETENSETITVDLRHALADVYFDVSAITDFTVTKIEIINAYSKADCAVAGGDLDDTDVTKAFTWSSQSTKAMFSMTDGFGAGDAPDHFLMIPQTLPSDAKLKITVQKNSTTKTKEIAFPATWKSGKYYKYKLTYDGAEYFFSLDSGSASPVTAKTVSYESKTTENSHDIIVSSQKNSVACDWDIKSYQVGLQDTVNLARSETGFTAAGLVVSENSSGGQKKLTIKASGWTQQSVGTNEYWRNATSRTNDLSWSPESWSDKGVIDLSKLDYTEATSYSTSNPMRTSNCYIIRHAGTYKLPLVYGNALDFSVSPSTGDNSQAYAPSMAAMGVSDMFLGNFKNHKDSDISSPFIENHSNCTASTSGSNAPCVVWSEHSGVITNLSIEGNTQTPGNYNAGNVRYLQFTIPQDKICQNNAVIAVKDNSGNIMWSWHIWTTNDPALLKPAIPVTNYGNTEFGFFPLNCLGWADSGTYPSREDVTITLVQQGSDEEVTITVKQPKTLSDDKSTGVHYQWGRKDPMPASSNTVNGFQNQDTSSGVTLGAAIQNPGYFYLNTGSNKSWCSSTYYNLWSGRLSRIYSSGLGDDITTKTIYDPSPVGYKVPSISAFSGFTTDGKSHDYNIGYYVNARGDFNYGWNFYTKTYNPYDDEHPTIFFPAAGWRDSSGLHIGTDGNFHSAYMWKYDDSIYKICYFAFSANDILLTNNQFTTLGCSVRSVTE